MFSPPYFMLTIEAGARWCSLYLAHSLLGLCKWCYKKKKKLREFFKEDLYKEDGKKWSMQIKMILLLKELQDLLTFFDKSLMHDLLISFDIFTDHIEEKNKRWKEKKDSSWVSTVKYLIQFLLCVAFFPPSRFHFTEIFHRKKTPKNKTKFVLQADSCFLASGLPNYFILGAVG